MCIFEYDSDIYMVLFMVVKKVLVKRFIVGKVGLEVCNVILE